MLSGILGVLGTDSDSYNIIKRIFTNEYFLKYDYIIFDTAGTINLLSSNAIKAADKILIPMLDDFFNIAVDDKPRKPRSYKFSENHIATIKKCLISQKHIIDTKLYDEIMNLLNQ